MTESADNTSECTDRSPPPTALTACVRVPKRVLFVLMGLLLLCGVLLFPFPMNSRAWNAAFDLAHAPSFFVAVVILAILLDPTLVRWTTSVAPLVRLSPARLSVLGLTVAAIGAGCEIAQSSVGRSPSISDALANSAGAISACLMLSCCRAIPTRTRSVFLIIGLGLLLLPAIHPMLEFHEVWLAEKQFPLIASFERPRELHGWYSRTARLEQTDEWSADGTHSLKIQSLKTGRQANASMVWPPHDWTPFDYLEMTFRNPNSANVTVSIHVADLQHTRTGFEPTDRFRREYLIPANSQQTIQIPSLEVLTAPVGRSTDLSQIAFLNVVIDKKNDLIVFLDRLLLAKSAEK